MLLQYFYRIFSQGFSTVYIYIYIYIYIFYCTEINGKYIDGYKLFRLPIYFYCHSSILVNSRGT